MFTGIIETLGSVQAIEKKSGDIRFIVNVGKLDMSDVSLGDSIAVNGICLTAIAFDETTFTADVSNETISLTTLKDLKIGSAVNLEKALLPTTRLGGHLVSGHVDGIGVVTEIKQDARSIRIKFKAPPELNKYIATKGSICVDGVSLTVNSIQPDGGDFSLNIVPHTQERTIMQHYKVGQQVNLEVDLVARYLESLLMGAGDTTEDKKAGISKTLLSDAGFLK